ncbi:YrzQ family protein [Cytobacillus suaedae]|uniref:YrzQ family protein n=1 Tax=Litchfieldia luteola TaxID=682179 RepID=A0ABR9QI30_9BACI|nr:YrzQ family protein [Cytobacillus luteolus]MBE4908086.1 YrzQ family protein [Cytobacillus luteolus]MBP1942871.1 hypothetical protein [Cytobacillus luteolus]QOR65637.1 YrzQ family protein [Cytobacillus suaedae]
MNRTMTSLIALGIGAVAYNYAQKNNMMNNKTMKQMRKRLARAIS